MDIAEIISQLTDGDISDLELIGSNTYSDDSRLVMSRWLDDGGAKLRGLGLAEERAPGRLATTPDGLDVLHELRRRAA